MSTDPSEGAARECCVSGYLESGTSKGEEILVAGLPTYWARAGVEPSKHVILFLTDVFGFRFNNSRLVADMYAENGFDVYIPDLHNGKSLEPAIVDVLIQPATSLGKGIKKAFRIAGSLPELVKWQASSSRSTSISKMEAVIRELRSEKFGAQKIATVGFCWGGPLSAIAATGQVDAAMIGHPIAIPIEVIEKISVPTIWNLAEEDPGFQKPVVEAVRKSLSESNKTFEITEYKDVKHGFLVRGDPNDKTYAEAKKVAHAKTLAFFKEALQTS
ncbi:dienelactone hydrolase [Cladochytrium replicatum]|nr:dienelactone hydrolase [Cladochytrium replicatum]